MTCCIFSTVARNVLSPCGPVPRAAGHAGVVWRRRGLPGRRPRLTRYSLYFLSNVAGQEGLPARECAPGEAQRKSGRAVAEAPRSDQSHQIAEFPLTLDAADFPLIQRMFMHQIGILLSDTKHEPEWRSLKSCSQLRSWLGVPLVASRQTLGLLSLGHSAPNTFTQEHLRLSESLAIPAAAAIQNARLYECAKIYGSELEKRTEDLQEAQSALQRFQSRRPS